MPFTAINPYSEEVIAQYGAHTSDEVEQFLATATEAFRRGRQRPSPTAPWS